MPSGTVLILKSDLSSPNVYWEDDSFAFDFSQTQAILSGDTLAGTPIVSAGTPQGATALSLGVRVAPMIVGNQVIFSITLPTGSPANYLYAITCRVPTTQGRTLIASGILEAVSSQ